MSRMTDLALGRESGVGPLRRASRSRIQRNDRARLPRPRPERRSMSRRDSERRTWCILIRRRETRWCRTACDTGVSAHGPRLPRPAGRHSARPGGRAGRCRGRLLARLGGRTRASRKASRTRSSAVARRFRNALAKCAGGVDNRGIVEQRQRLRHHGRRLPARAVGPHQRLIEHGQQRQIEVAAGIQIQAAPPRSVRVGLVRRQNHRAVRPALQRDKRPADAPIELARDGSSASRTASDSRRRRRACQSS